MISINKRLMIIWHEIKLEYYKNAKKKKKKQEHETWSENQDV
jgi:hypothetical protein